MPGREEDLTVLLNLSDESDSARERLWTSVYPELRRRARRLLRGERKDHTLTATAVANEVFLRLESEGPREWTDRTHFYAVASTIMRHVLIDHARSRSAAKRGGGATRTSLDEELFPDLAADDTGYQTAREALEALSETDERAATVVVLRVFGGLTVPEVAAEIGVSERTVKNDWTSARAVLRELLEG